MGAIMMCSEIKDVKSKSSKQIFLHELAHHLPYGTLAVASGLLFVSLLSVLFKSVFIAPHMHEHVQDVVSSCSRGGGFHGSNMDILFHTFHYTHILFAVSGTMMTFYRHAQRMFLGILVGVPSAMFFCTLSDVLLPYVAGQIFGMHMHLHICFYNELANILPFLIIGAINGVIMFYIQDFKAEGNSLQLHFAHTLVSTLASIFYAIGNGFHNFNEHFGLFFILILVAVVIPCTLADVVVPVIIARMVKK